MILDPSAPQQGPDAHVEPAARNDPEGTGHSGKGGKQPAERRETEGGGISALFIRFPIATSLVAIGVLFVGLIAYPLLSVAPLPQVDFPTISVSVQFSGASPETMASSVAQPLERQLAQIPGVAQMTSVSALGSTSITIQFDLDRSIDAAAQDVQAAINGASGQLPANLPSPPTYRKVNPADAPIMMLSATSDTLPLTAVDDTADTKIAQQLSQIAGVGQVIIGGEQKPAIRLQIDPARLANKGLSLEDVRNGISALTLNSPKGSIDGPNRSFTIYNNDQLTKASEWNRAIVSYVNSAAVRVSDIGTAISGPEDTKKAAWANGKRGVFLIIFKQPNANVIDTVDRIQAELPRLRASIPPTVDITVISDRTQTIRASVHDVQITLLITIALVVMVIFVFLRRFWATVIPSLTVPLALMGTFALMYVAGYSLDNLSLMALTISVGFVVDDAIVMLENIVRHIEDGESPRDAAFRGAREIGFTIISISLSLTAVFIPLLLMGGIIGRLFREFAMTVTMTIGISALISLTLIPMLASRFLTREDKAKEGRVSKLVERGFDAVAHAYERGLDRVLAHQFATLIVFFLTLAASATLFYYVPKGFFPEQDTGFIQGTSEAAQDISFAEMLQRQQALGDVVMKDPDVANVAMTIGAGGTAQTLNNGRLYISLKPRAERTASARGIIDRLRPKIAAVEGINLFLQPAQDINVGGRQSRTQYQYTLEDADIGELNTWAPKLLDKLKTLKELTDVGTDQQTSGTTLTLDIDRDQAARFGVTPEVIDNTLYDAFGQRQIAQYFTQLNSYHVILEVRPDLQETPTTLNRIYVKSATSGQQVPLAAFAKWSTREIAPLSISHQGQFPAVTLNFNLAPGVSLGQATQIVAQAQEQIGAPGTLSGNFQGTAQAFQQSLASEPYLVAGALVVVYLILGILYESYIHPLTILSTLPSAGLGALAMLMLFGFDFSVIGLIGIVLLIGIVKKNGIMMVDFAITGERDDGLSPHDAIRRACLLRFRPIMMTTAAAMLGGVPLMLGHGAGSEIRQPLGYAMVGGLIVSQALTLFTTPVVYLYLDRLSAAVRGRLSRRKTANAAKTGKAAAA